MTKTAENFHNQRIQEIEHDLKLLANYDQGVVSRRVIARLQMELAEIYLLEDEDETT